MPITPPAAYQVLKKVELIAAPGVPGPLNDILENANHLYVRHRPALVSHAPTVSASNADRSFVLPLPTPSQDGLVYDFRICVQADGVGTVDLITDYSNDTTVSGAAWNNLDTTAAFATVNGFAVHQFAAVLPRTARLLRLNTDNATVNVRITHLFAAPDPDTAADPFDPGGADLTSLFRVHDRALLGTANRPVTTELVDRCWRNAVALLQDRKQVVATLLSPDDRTTATTKAPQAWAPTTAAGAWITVGRAPAYLPPAAGSQVALQVEVYGTVSGGGATDRISVEVMGSNMGVTSVLLDASGSIESGALIVEPSGEGMIDLVVKVRAQAGQTVAVHAVTVWWSPAANLDPLARLTGTGFLVAAMLTLLVAADTGPRNVALGLYAAVGHMVDGATTGRTQVQAHLVIPRALQDLRLVAWRMSDGDAATPFGPKTKVYGDTDGSLAAPADCIAVPYPGSGADQYWECTGAVPPGVPPSLLVAGDVQNLAPAGEQDRCLNVLEDLVTSVELVQLDFAIGWCLRPGHRTADPETL